MNQINQNQVNFYSVDFAAENQRLDNLLIKILKGVPKSHIYRIIRSGEVRLNGSRCEPNNKVKLDDTIRIPPLRLAAFKAATIIPAHNFSILYEDDYFLIIDKPAGIACHGGSGIAWGVIEQLRHSITSVQFLELVHRLDKETSGILIIAKKRQALIQLQESIKRHLLIKEYYVLTLGIWHDAKRNVKAPIYKYLTAGGERRVRIDQLQGKLSHTVFTRLETFATTSLINASLQTGRTHQIRIHSAHLGYPVAGDEKYGNFASNKLLAKQGLSRMFLHAHHVQFTHPITQQTLDIVCPLPLELHSFLQILRNAKP